MIVLFFLPFNHYKNKKNRAPVIQKAGSRHLIVRKAMGSNLVMHQNTAPNSIS